MSSKDQGAGGSRQTGGRSQGARKRAATRGSSGRKGAAKQGSGRAAVAKAKRRAEAAHARRSATRSTKLQRAFKRVALGVALVAFVFGFWLAGWVLELDRIVTRRFEGRTFSVPSKVLSAPTILYPGLNWRQLDLRSTLRRLGYREQRAEVGDPTMPPGRFSWAEDRLRIHLRAFEHPSRPEQRREVELWLDRDVIAEVRSLSDGPGKGREVGAVLLEPELVGAYYGRDREQRDLVRLADVPPALPQAIFAVEDRRFESHHGVDFRRVAGALVANLRAGGIRQGGSTLTQQLVKNFFLTPDRTLQRKLQEAVMAVIVELRYDKTQILESYLNEIYLGHRGSTAIHGVGEATHFFFGKQVADLSLAESAQIAGTIQGPNRLSPHRNPEAAKERRNLVLALMWKQGRIDRAQYDAARHEPIQVAELTPERSETRYFLDALRRQLPEVYDQDVLSATGLQIYSTLDPRFQSAAVSALVDGLEAIESRHPKLLRTDPAARLQGCLVALRPQTGEVLALVGGRDYGVSQYDRCTQARRQVGSVFKPFVYTAALEPVDGEVMLTLASILDDSPFELETRSGIWAPENYDHKFRGEVGVREALARSMNVPAARLAQEVGIDRVAAVAQRLGISSPLPRVPSLALGTAELSPLEVGRAFATLASGGFRATPHTFEDVTAPGRTLARRTLHSERALDPATAFLVTSMLQDVVNAGTAVRVRWMGIEGPVAGKTGTTDDEYDLWFVGYTPELVAVVWMGFDEPQPIRGVSSSEGPLPIWVNFVKRAVGSSIRGAFLRPPEIREAQIDPLSGSLALADCPRRRLEYFIPGTEPTQTCPPSSERDFESRRGRRTGERGGADDGSRRGILHWLRDRF